MSKNTHPDLLFIEKAQRGFFGCKCKQLFTINKLQVIIILNKCYKTCLQNATDGCGIVPHYWLMVLC